MRVTDASDGNVAEVGYWRLIMKYQTAISILLDAIDEGAAFCQVGVWDGWLVSYWLIVRAKGEGRIFAR